MFRTHASYYFWSLALTIVAEAETCYYSDGTVAETDTPCRTGGNSTCCGFGSYCAINNVCVQFVGGYVRFDRGSCTDPTFSDPACPLYCLDPVYTGTLQACSANETLFTACCILASGNDVCGCNSDGTGDVAFPPLDLYAVINDTTLQSGSALALPNEVLYISNNEVYEEYYTLATPTLLTASSVTPTSTAAPTCYYADASVAIYDKPCNIEGTFSTCCGPEFMCTEDNMCYNPGGQVTNNGHTTLDVLIRGSCTDSTFSDPACPLYCLSATTMDGGLTICAANQTGTTLCCNGLDGTCACDGSDGDEILFGGPLILFASEPVTSTATGYASSYATPYEYLYLTDSTLATGVFTSSVPWDPLHTSFGSTRSSTPSQTTTSASLSGAISIATSTAFTSPSSTAFDSTATTMSVSMDAAQPFVTASATSSGLSTSLQSSSSLSGGAIAGIVVGAIVGVALAAVVAWYFLRRRGRAQPKSPPTPWTDQTSYGPNGMVASEGAEMQDIPRSTGEPIMQHI